MVVEMVVRAGVSSALHQVSTTPSPASVTARPVRRWSTRTSAGARRSLAKSAR